MLGRVCSFLHPLPAPTPFRPFACYNSRIRVSAAAQMETGAADVDAQRSPKVIDSYLHVWASPQQAAEKYPYFPGQEPTLTGHADFLLENMAEAGVDGALIVQPINHKFDHSYVSSVLKTYPSKFVGCCLANPAEDGGGIKQLENLITEAGYRAVRFNPYLWPSGQLMTNEVGKAMFSKAGELGVPVGFICMKGLELHLKEIEQLCTEFPSTVVLLDHIAFCKPPTNDDEAQLFSKLLNLSRFPQVYVKFSALFRVSTNPYPYEDLSNMLSEIVSTYGANRVMWGSDFPFVVSECGYKEAKEAVCHLAERSNLTTSALEWIMGHQKGAGRGAGEACLVRIARDNKGSEPVQGHLVTEEGHFPTIRNFCEDILRDGVGCFRRDFESVAAQFGPQASPSLVRVLQYSFSGCF